MKNRDMTKEAKRLRAMRRGARLLRRTKKTAQKRHLGRKLALGAGAGLFLIAPGRSSRKASAPFVGRNFAHRGLHTEDKSVPENSMAAFAAAAAAGYGIELDVQLSKDRQVVVFHDATLDRVCGVKSRVDEKTYDELHATSLCGTKETVPLFSDVLKCIDGRGPLIVELKTGKHNRELCRKTLALLKDYRGDVCIESFDPRIVRWFRFHAGKLIRGQLACRPSRYERKDASKKAAFLLGNCLLNFLGRPQFIAYEIGRKPLTVKLAERLGAMRFCWTSHDMKNEKKNDAVIFELYTPEIKLLK
jgi:glycerophosphoryl diester phosphodiesterase